MGFMWLEGNRVWRSSQISISRDAGQQLVGMYSGKQGC